MDSWIMYIRFGYVKSFIIKICYKVFVFVMWLAGHANAILRDFFKCLVTDLFYFNARLVCVVFFQLLHLVTKVTME